MAFSQLIDKLESFQKKYYKNQLIKGLIYATAIITLLIIVLASAEYFGRFNSVGRGVLLSFLVTGLLYTTVRFLLIPLFKLYKIGKVISYQEASKIIGKHFPDVSDKLLNTLQLKAQADINGADNSLLIASIDQRIEELQPIPFINAIDFSANKKYLKYAIPPILALLLIWVTSPHILSEGTKRIVQFNQEFVPQAPFTLSVVNESLSAAQEEDFVLKVETNGNVVPAEVYVVQNGTKLRLKQSGKTNFHYTFNQVQNTFDFQLWADGFNTGTYTLEVKKKAVITGFSIAAEYPKYLQMDKETFQGQGDITVPEGTQLSWQFLTKNTSQFFFVADTSVVSSTGTNGNFSVEKQALQSFQYKVSTGNAENANGDTLVFSVSVIPDQYPKIQVEEKSDSVSSKLIYFKGKITDDYGFSNLYFAYKPADADQFVKEKLPVTRSLPADDFFYTWSLQNLNLKPGDNLPYYFEVYDNDGVNGAKSTKTSERVFAVPTQEELDKKIEDQNKDIEESLKKGVKDAKELQEEIKKLNRNLLDEKKLDWKDKKQIEKVLEKQKKLEKTVEQIQQQNEEKNLAEQEFESPEKQEELLQKQEQLEQLFDQLMTPEMKEMYKEMQQMMEKLDKDKVLQKLEEMKFDNENLEKELDRSLEIFKQMEFEQKYNQTMDELKELAEKQKELSEETKDGKTGEEELKKKQDELNEKFEKVSEKLEDMKKDAKDLNMDVDMDNLEPQQKQTEEEQQSASENLEQGKKNKAAENQKNAAEKMEEMAQQMEQMQQEAQEQQNAEDMEALRQLLDNLVKLSFDQEQLMVSVGQTSTSDPQYLKLTQDQKKYKDDAALIRDSLFALSKRIPQLSSFVNREVGLVYRNMNEAIDQMAERQIREVGVNQQYVMTSLNNLALILDEALQQMQQQMQQQKQGNGSCSKPGQGKPKPGMGQMKKMQQRLSQQMEQMKKQLEKNGNKPGKKPGERSGRGQGGMSKELAQMAAEQAAIRKQIQELSKELNKEGKGAGNSLKDIAKKMEENEEDIVNRNINIETLKRQQEILTRMLEAENAEQQREYDNKRKSQSPGEYPVANPKSYFDYKKDKLSENEILKTIPAGLSPYYKTKVADYMNAE